MNDTMSAILFWVLLPYDAIIFLPYLWVRVALGIATGLFIRGKTIGLVACALGNLAVFAYAAFLARHPGSMSALEDILSSAWSNPKQFLMTCLFIFGSIVFWFVGRIMRWAFYKIRGHAPASAS
jgi:hypothetical protein